MDFAEKLGKLSERTNIDEALLQQLPDERITHYFNESSGSASHFTRGLATVAASMCGLSTLLNFATGNLPMAFAMLSLTAVNAMNAINNHEGISKNAEVADNINTELALQFAPVTNAEPAKVEEQPIPTGPRNGPIKDAHP